MKNCFKALPLLLLLSIAFENGLVAQEPVQESDSPYYNVDISVKGYLAGHITRWRFLDLEPTEKKGRLALHWTMIEVHDVPWDDGDGATKYGTVWFVDCVGKTRRSMVLMTYKGSQLVNEARLSSPLSDPNFLNIKLLKKGCEVAAEKAKELQRGMTK